MLRKLVSKLKLSRIIYKKDKIDRLVIDWAALLRGPVNLIGFEIEYGPNKIDWALSSVLVVEVQLDLNGTNYGSN